MLTAIKYLKAKFLIDYIRESVCVCVCHWDRSSTQYYNVQYTGGSSMWLPQENLQFTQYCSIIMLLSMLYLILNISQQLTIITENERKIL